MRVVLGRLVCVLACVAAGACSTTEGGDPSSVESGGAAGTSNGGSTTTGGSNNPGGATNTGGAMTTGSGGSTASGGSSGGDGGIHVAIDAGTVDGTPGVWTRLLNWPLATMLISGEGLVVDPVRPSDFYFFYETGTPNAGGDRHVLKTTDYGTTWTRIEKTASKGNAWGVAIDPNPNRDPNTPPTMYTPAGYGDLGMWKSVDGGVTWKNLIPSSGVVTKPGGGTATFPPDKNGGHIDFYQAHILPDNPPNHVLVTYHYGTGALQALGETTDGGATWEVHNVPWGDSHYVYATDPNTWILVAGRSGPGTYRTTTAGRVNGVISEAAWTQVNNFTHSHGSFTPFIDKKNDVLYFPGENDFPVQGVRRSADHGATWVSIYDKSPVGMLIGTGSHMYASWLGGNSVLSGAIGDTPNFMSSMPAGFTGSVPPYGAATSFDGHHWVAIVAQYLTSQNNMATGNGELWRYIEP